MVAVAGVLIRGIRRSLGLQYPRRRQGTTSDDEPLLGARPFTLEPRLHPALDYLDVHWPFLPVTHRQMRPRIGRKGLPPRCYRLPWGFGPPSAPWVLGQRGLQIAYRGGAGHAQHIPLATLAQFATKLRVATHLVITGDPAVRHLMPPRVEHLHTQLLAGLVPHLRWHAACLASWLIPCPLLRQRQTEVEQGVIVARDVAHEHADLAVVDLPSVAAPLTLDAHRMC